MSSTLFTGFNGILKLGYKNAHGVQVFIMSVARKQHGLRGEEAVASKDRASELRVNPWQARKILDSLVWSISEFTVSTFLGQPPKMNDMVISSRASKP